MDRLNYDHLLYFFTVARLGSVAAAARALRLSAPTVSAQVKDLERAVGAPLLVRERGRMAPTEAGRLAYGYAEEIFRLGAELERGLEAGVGAAPPRLAVGAVDGIPKPLVARLLEPVVSAGAGLAVSVREGPASWLFDALTRHDLDVVLADVPGDARLPAGGHSHLLGECGLGFFGTARFAGLRRGFPRTLDGAPVLLPAAGTALRAALEAWFVAEGVRPQAAGVFDDGAMAQAFGARGAGVFVAPTAVEAEVCRELGVARVGATDAVRDRFYAVTVARRIRHPAVAALATAARQGLARPDPARS